MITFTKAQRVSLARDLRRKAARYPANYRYDYGLYQNFYREVNRDYSISDDLPLFCVVLKL